MQTDYNNLAPGVKGGVADSDFADIVSKQSAEVIEFGLGVVVLDSGAVAVPAELTDVLYGIAVQKHKAVPNASPLEARYEIGDDISVLRQGRIFVYAEEAVDPTADVYMRVTAFGVDANYEDQVPGNFRTDADTETVDTAVVVLSAKWAETTTGPGLTVLEINNP